MSDLSFLVRRILGVRTGRISMRTQQSEMTLRPSGNLTLRASMGRQLGMTRRDTP